MRQRGRCFRLPDSGYNRLSFVTIYTVHCPPGRMTVTAAYETRGTGVPGRSATRGRAPLLWRTWMAIG